MSTPKLTHEALAAIQQDREGQSSTPWEAVHFSGLVADRQLCADEVNRVFAHRHALLSHVAALIAERDTLASQLLDVAAEAQADILESPWVEVCPPGTTKRLLDAEEALHSSQRTPQIEALVAKTWQDALDAVEKVMGWEEPSYAWWLALRLRHPRPSAQERAP